MAMIKLGVKKTPKDFVVPDEIKKKMEIEDKMNKVSHIPRPKHEAKHERSSSGSTSPR